MLEYFHATLILEKGPWGYLVEELSNAQFTTYANITSLAGVSQGNAINEGAGWLRFIMDNKELIVAKKNIRSGQEPC